MQKNLNYFKKPRSNGSNKAEKEIENVMEDKSWFSGNGLWPVVT